MAGSIRSCTPEHYDGSLSWNAGSPAPECNCSSHCGQHSDGNQAGEQRIVKSALAQNNIAAAEVHHKAASEEPLSKQRTSATAPATVAGSMAEHIDSRLWNMFESFCQARAWSWPIVPSVFIEDSDLLIQVDKADPWETPEAPPCHNGYPSHGVNEEGSAGEDMVLAFAGWDTPKKSSKDKQTVSLAECLGISHSGKPKESNDGKQTVSLADALGISSRCQPKESKEVKQMPQTSGMAVAAVKYQ